MRYTLPALLALFVLAGFTAVSAQPDPPASSHTWNVDQAHSQVQFRVRHLGLSRVTGSFASWNATLELDPADLSTLRATAAIDVSSIDTGIERRDNHLRSDDFFDAASYPQMKFVSKRVTDVGGDTFKLVGDLTIRDVTREVVLDGELLGTSRMRGNEVIGITAEGAIDRRDYGLKWNNLTEAGAIVVGHKVRIMLEIEANRPAPGGE